MPEFTGLERAVLTAICDEQPGIAGRLRGLLATARTLERDNTGHGFYTPFEVDRSLPYVDWPQRIVSGPNVEVNVASEILLMGFVLWFEDGYPNRLEGFQYGMRSGGHIDLKVADLSAIAWVRPVS